MNVKEHKWLVWLVVISLMLGMWNGSVVKGEEDETGKTTGQVKEITRVDIEMGDPVGGELLPSVTVKEVQVESPTSEIPVIETISTESVTVEEVSWSSRKSEGEDFSEIDDWQNHQVENNTKYKVEITLKAKEYIFSEKVAIYKEQDKGEIIKNEESSEVKVSWTFTVGTLSTQTPSPTTSATSSPTQTPAETEVPQTETKAIESVHIDGVSPPVGGEEFPKEELIIAESAAIETFLIEWKDGKGAEVQEEKAEYEKEYQLWIGLEAKKDYEFAESLKVFVNSVGEGFEVEREKDGKKVTIKCEFKTGKEPTQSASPLPTQSALPTTEPSPESPSIEAPLPVVSLPPTPPTTYTITLVPNGGTVPQKSISFTAEEVSKVKLPDPTRKDYVFIGWYEGKKRVEKITEPKNMTLKAQWVTASIEMGYLGTLKWAKFKLSSDVKLTEVSIEKKYKKFVKINNKKKTLKGKKYFKKANLTLKIDGKNVTGVVLKMKIPEAKIIVKKAGGRKHYVIGVYRTYQLAYAHKPGATKAVAEYSYKKKGKYKKCVKALNRLKGGSVSVKKGRTVYMRVTIYYGKNAYSKSKPKPLKG